MQESAKYRNGTYQYPPDAAAIAQNPVAARREVHTFLKQINHDFQKHQFNTVVSGAMKILHAVQVLMATPESQDVSGPMDPRGFSIQQSVLHESISILLRVLAPITPHYCHYLWLELDFGADILDAAWPEPDPQALIADEIELVLQVNGKLRGNMRVRKDADRAQIEKLAMLNPNVQKHVNGQPVKKVVVVPGRLVNVVV